VSERIGCCFPTDLHSADIGFTCTMTIAGMPESIVCALYSAQMMRPVTLSTMNSYRHRYPMFQAINCLRDSFESFSQLICTLAGEFNKENADRIPPWMPAAPGHVDPPTTSQY